MAVPRLRAAVTLSVAMSSAANRVEVPSRQLLPERCSIRPSAMGGIGTVRSKTWIWDLSSTPSTIAFSGGARYRPQTSVTLPTSSGSVENRNDSAFHGLPP